MASRPLPRYFVSRSDSEWSEQGVISQLEPVHAIDSFFIGGRHVVEREWLVTIDAAGYLKALSDDELSDLPQEVQQDLAFNEVIGSAASRSMDGVEFYVFHMEALEQPPETPGLNDPVYLYGTMYGPFPAASEDCFRGIQGQLTVNRIDLLAGVVNSAQYSFHYQTGAAGGTQRCFNILLPGDREEEINRGKGLVMTYPLMPGDVGLGDPWNEFLVSNLIYDMLSALKDDIQKEKVNHPLKDMTLPVVSRFSFEKELESRGYVIKGEVAMRQPGAAGGSIPNILPDVLSKPLPSAITNAIGRIIKDKFTLPPEGTVDDFITLAQQTLAKLPGYPPPRAKALQSRVRSASVEARSGTTRKTAAAPRPIKTPTGNVSSPPSPKKAKKADWMNDFITTHRQPQSGNETRLTNLSNVAATAQQAAVVKKTVSKNPDWMNDFGGQQSATTKKEEKRTQESQPKPSEAKPDWMNDFD